MTIKIINNEVDITSLGSVVSEFMGKHNNDTEYAHIERQTQGYALIYCGYSIFHGSLEDIERFIYGVDIYERAKTKGV